MFINRYVFLCMYSANIWLTTTLHCSPRAIKHYWLFLMQVRQMYTLQGFKIAIIKADFGLQRAEWLCAQQTTIVASARSCGREPACRIDGTQHTVCEREVKLLQLTLPFKRIPGCILVQLVQVVTPMMNALPWSRGTQYLLSMIMSDWGLLMDQLPDYRGSVAEEWSSIIHARSNCDGSNEQLNWMLHILMLANR